MRFLFISIITCFCFSADAQPYHTNFEASAISYTPSTKTFFYKLGERMLPIKVKQYGDVDDLIFINMHDDENSSVEATKTLLEKRGGLLIEVDNFQKRNIKFKLGTLTFQFDPNRIFTRDGIYQTLQHQNKRIHERAVNEVEKFGQWLLSLIPENPKCVIALHNNTEGNFTIKNYLPDGDRKDDARNLNISDLQDIDDFFITTDENIFSSMKEAGYNIMLQDNINARKDGSLSMYCGEKNMSYVNLETQHGKVAQYKEMMEKLLDFLDKPIQNFITYNFQILSKDFNNEANLNTGIKIYFNEKEVGKISSIELTDDKEVIKGKLSMHTDFPIYSNSDFFLIQQLTGDPIIEIRIDPTREKTPIIDFENHIVKLYLK